MLSIWNKIIPKSKVVMQNTSRRVRLKHSRMFRSKNSRANSLVKRQAYCLIANFTVWWCTRTYTTTQEHVLCSPMIAASGFGNLVSLSACRSGCTRSWGSPQPGAARWGRTAPPPCATKMQLRTCSVPHRHSKVSSRVERGARWRRSCQRLLCAAREGPGAAVRGCRAHHRARQQSTHRRTADAPPVDEATHRDDRKLQQWADPANLNPPSNPKN